MKTNGILFDVDIVIVADHLSSLALKPKMGMILFSRGGNKLPMNYDDELVGECCKDQGLSTEGTVSELRERLASHIETKYKDYVEAWEIRTGRPWTTMTVEEAKALIKLHPVLMRNPGVLSRLTQ